MDFTLHNDFSAIPETEWNTLVEQGISDVPFLRHEYLRQWWQTLGGGEWQQAELVLISAREDGRLIGLAPLFKAQYDGRPALLLVGSIEISDYLDLIVRGDDLPRFLAGLLGFLAQSSAYGGLPLDWYNLPDSSPTLAALHSEAERRGLTYRQETYRPTPRIALNGSFEDYLSRVEKKQRHEIRRKLRRAAESEIPVRFYVVEAAAALEPEIEAFLQLMDHDASKASFLTPPMREQMRSVIRTAFDHGYLWLAFLTVDGVKAAACLNFDYKNKLWGYNSGVSREFMELSPGWVLLGHQLQWACEHGRAEFDFMRGGEEYKYRFGAVNRYVLRAGVDWK
ncbi:MAG TPA: GNAT family N-acetyltransferase [Anaerolineales bacterium]|nr:GNAT family N-acetyltransferase [Anaerolineales bacterium]